MREHKTSNSSYESQQLTETRRCGDWNLVTVVSNFAGSVTPKWHIIEDSDVLKFACLDVRVCTEDREVMRSSLGDALSLAPNTSMNSLAGTAQSLSRRSLHYGRQRALERSEGSTIVVTTTAGQWRECDPWI